VSAQAWLFIASGKPLSRRTARAQGRRLHHGSGSSQARSGFLSVAAICRICHASQMVVVREADAVATRANLCADNGQLAVSAPGETATRQNRLTTALRSFQRTGPLQ
jgi:hypothetical protein